MIEKSYKQVSNTFKNNNHDNWIKNKKVIQSQKMFKKMPKKLKNSSLKIHRVAGIFKNLSI